MGELSPLEKILKTPGLIHLAEKVFGNFDDVKICRDINQSSREILDNPMFWLKKFESLSKKNQKDWIKVIKSVKNSEKEKAIISYLQWNLRKNVLWDLPCYSSPDVQDDFHWKIWEICHTMSPTAEDLNMVKILIPLADNPNPPCSNGYTVNTPIYWAAQWGHTEIVKIMAPLTNNPNAPNNDGDTPIHKAAFEGHTEIVKILAPLTNNPNAPNNDGETPIEFSMYNFNVCRILMSFSISRKHN